MKKFILVLLFIVFMAMPCIAALDPSIDNTNTWKNAYRFTNKPKDLFLDWCVAVEDALDGTDGISYLYLVPSTSPATAAKGQLYFDTSTSNLKYYTTSWQTLGISSSGTLDEAYEAGQGITVDLGAVTLTTSATSDSVALAVVGGETGNFSPVTVSNASAYPGIAITSTSTGADITGTSATWSISKAGAITCVGVDSTGTVTLANDETILNDTDGEIQFGGNGTEDVSFGFGTSNTLTLTSDTAVDTIAFGDLDAFTGVASVAGDAGADFALSAANTGTYNFTITQAGTGDNELRLVSAGTAANAIALTSSTGGITATAATSITASAAAGAISVAATGGDITIDSTDQSVIIRGTEEAGDAIVIDADGTAGGIDIAFGTGNLAITGTGASADFTVDGDLFSIDGTGTSNVTVTSNAGAEDFTVALAGATDSSLVLSSTGTGADALQVTTTAGGIVILNGGAAAGEDIDVTSTNASINLSAGEAAGDAIVLSTSDAAGGIDITSGTGDVTITSTDDIVLTNATAVGDMIQLLNTAGTSVTEDSAAIQLTATAGGIQIQSDAAIDGDTVILRADGGATADILIHNDAGTGADCINLLADEGGITLTADGATAGDILIDAEDDIQLTTTGKLTITNTEATTISGALTVSGATSVASVVIADTVITTGTFTITAAMSGKILVIPDLAGNTVIDLPAEADGLNYEFWYVGAAAESHDHTIDTEDAGNNFVGGVQFIDSDDDGHTPVYSTVATNSKLLLSNLEAGSIVKLTCDGTEWYITGIVYSDTAPSFADQ